jgi:hypothetical protein
MGEQIFTEDSFHSEVTKLKRLIEQLRSNLYYLEEQVAHYGPMDTPIRLRNAIEETTKVLGEKEAQLRTVQLNKGKKLVSNTEIKRFWEPFVSEGAKFFVAHHLPDNVSEARMQVNALTLRAVHNMYRLLVEQFADSLEVGSIQLEVGTVIKSDTELRRLVTSSHPHLIVIGAPGANPLSNHLMAKFKGIPPYGDDSIVHQGYIFRVSGDYLGSPFIVSNEGSKHYSSEEQLTIQELGIYDLKPNHAPRFFPRTFEQYGIPSPSDHWTFDKVSPSQQTSS